jgi:hypothetical protein
MVFLYHAWQSQQTLTPDGVKNLNYTKCRFLRFIMCGMGGSCGKNLKSRGRM